MRVIAGEFKGRRLSTPKGRDIRPTADRVREAVFNIIGPRVHGAVVLDLFAGTGALGIEALSRGAIAATFVDTSREALGVIRRNIEICALKARTHVISCDVYRSLGALGNHNPPFDLVFADPPYHCGYLIPAMENLHASGCLSESALIVVEHDPREPVVAQQSHFQVTDARRYGATAVTFLVYSKDALADETQTTLP